MMTKGIWVGLVGVLVVALPSLGLCEDDYPTNLEMIEQAVRMAVDSMDVRAPAGTDSYLEIDAGTGSEAAWLLDSVLKEDLLDQGWRIRPQMDEEADSTSFEDDEFLLRLRIVDLGLQYGRSWRRYLLGGKVVERIARASIFYELIDQAGDQVLTSSSVDGEVSDVVPASELSTLSNPKYPFASPELEKSRWDKYLEGGLVIAIIGVLVYLFYSNKTAS
jgi:hypothetical protein